MEELLKKKSTGYYVLGGYTFLASLYLLAVKNPRIDGDALIISIIYATSAAIAFAFLLYGLRLFKIYVIVMGMVIGLAIGAMLGGLMGASARAVEPAIIMGLIFAALGGIVAWPLQKVIIFILAGFWGAIIVCALLGLAKVMEPGLYFLCGFVAFIIVGILTLKLYEYIIIVVFALSAVNTFFFSTIYSFDNWGRRFDLKDILQGLSQHFPLFLIGAASLVLFSIHFQKFIRKETHDSELDSHKKQQQRDVAKGIVTITYSAYVFNLFFGSINIAFVSLLLFPIAIAIINVNIDFVKKFILRNRLNSVVASYLAGFILVLPIVLILMKDKPGFYLSLAFALIVFPTFYISWVAKALLPVGIKKSETPDPLPPLPLSKSEISVSMPVQTNIGSPPPITAFEKTTQPPLVIEEPIITPLQEPHEPFTPPKPVVPSVPYSVRFINFIKAVALPFKTLIGWLKTRSKRAIWIASGSIVAAISLTAWFLVAQQELNEHRETFHLVQLDTQAKIEMINQAEVRYEELTTYIKAFNNSKVKLTTSTEYLSGGIWFPTSRKELLNAITNFINEQNLISKDAQLAADNVKPAHQEVLKLYQSTRNKRRDAVNTLQDVSDNANLLRQSAVLVSSWKELTIRKSQTEKLLSQNSLEGKQEAFRIALLKYDIAFLKRETDSLLNRKNALEACDKLLSHHKMLTSQLLNTQSKVIPFIYSIANNLAPATRSLHQKTRYLDDAVATLNKPGVLGFTVMDGLTKAFPQAASTVELISDISIGIANVDNEMNAIVSTSKPFLNAQSFFQKDKSRRTHLELVRKATEVSQYYSSKKQLFNPVTDKLDEAYNGLESIGRSFHGASAFLSLANDIIGTAYRPFNAWKNTIDETTRVLDLIGENEQRYLVSIEKLRQYNNDFNDVIRESSLSITSAYQQTQQFTETKPTITPSISNPDVILKDFSATFVYVPSGTFTMGCPNHSSDCFPEENPAHTVSISSFYIAKYEVTQSEYIAVVGFNPSKNAGCLNCPVENVNWSDAKKFIASLNTKSGNNYRLPTEAEWEFAAYAGEFNYTYSGDYRAQNTAWIKDNSYGQSHPVGRKSANRLGVYDMTGNVWEWCEDWYQENYYSQSEQQDPAGPSSGMERILRGGSWQHSARYCRNANRGWDKPGTRKPIYGFRLASSVKPN